MKRKRSAGKKKGGPGLGLEAAAPPAKSAQRPQIIGERMAELIRLKERATDAAESFSEAIQKAATDAGYDKGAVRGFITARAGLKSARRRLVLEQQLELFAECASFDA